MENTLKKFPSALAILASILIVIPLVAILDSSSLSFGRPIHSHPLTSPLEYLFLAIVLTTLTLVIFRSNRSVLSKAVYAVVPVTIVLYYIINNGSLGWPVLTSYLLGALLISGVFAYLLYKKKPWQYKFSVIATSIVIFTATFSWVLYCNVL